MRENKITRTVEEVNGYYADDGTWFREKDECKKYEESAKMVVFKMIKDKMIAKTNIYNLLGEGSEDDAVEIFKVDSLETVELLNRYTTLSTYDKTAPFASDMIGKDIIIQWNYERDWCYCHDTIDDLLLKIKGNYEKAISKETTECEK